MIHKCPQIDPTMVCFDEKTKQAYEEAEKEYLLKRVVEKSNGNKACETEVIIEFLNLPMKTAFQNKDLTDQVRTLLEENGAGEWMRKLAHSERTFRQFTCLGGGELTSEICFKIYSLMEVQNQITPFSFTKMYPYLLDNSWQVLAKDISSIKVDIKYGNDWSLSIEKISGLYSSLADEPMVCFYPCQIEEKTNIIREIMRGKSCIVTYPVNKQRMLEMMKQILLYGTLDLREFGWNS